MSAGKAKRAQLLGWPWWVWGLILALGATQPLTHVLAAHFPPKGTVPTGMTIPDSSQFIYSMGMFSSGFESLYATCKSPHGTHYVGYYPFPFLWAYGLLGFVADGLGFDRFMFYGLATGVCACLYLAAVYGFLRQVLPRQADLAFVLFTLSGGLGGILYVLTALFGLHGAPGFEDYFRRFAMYELFEGPHLLPVTYLPRLYYTFSLGASLTALTLLIRAERQGQGKGRLALAMLLLLAGSLVNLRSGVFVCGIGLIYLWCREERPWRERLGLACVFVPPLVVAGLVTRSLMTMNPTVVSNVLDVANMAMWFSPFLSVVALHLFLAPREVGTRLRRLDPVARVCACGAVGYLAAFALLFVLYQAYYGNLLVCRDAAVAETISDWALIGAGLGLMYSGIRKPATRERVGPLRQSGRDEHGWVVLWLLAFLALSLSAFGQGWFLRFGPHRLQVVLWLPICILSALGLERLRARRPRAARVLGTALIGCGVCSVFVAVLGFQTPLGRAYGRGPYPGLHVEVMSAADAHVLAELGSGCVLAPSRAADAVVFTRGNPVVYGIGSFNLSDQPEILLRAEVARFFRPETTDAERRRIVQEWCADYVYCADTWPVAPEVVEALCRTPWLEEVAREGRAALFSVVSSQLPVVSTRPGSGDPDSVDR